MTTHATLIMIIAGIRNVTSLRRAVAPGLIVVLLAACSGAASNPRAASAPVAAAAQPSSVAILQSMPMGSASPPASRPTPPPAVGRSSPPPSPSPSASPATIAPSPPVLDPPTRPGPFAIDLYRRGDFVHQARSDWCVPAAILTMANLIDRPNRTALPSQRALDRRSRALSSSRLVGSGSEPQGWAGVLNRLGYGPYVVVAMGTRQEAISTAARALRATGRPVGMLVWRGAHAWVMSGFEATGDPARTNDFTVTRIRISDPWYPWASTARGRARAPDTRIGMAVLARNFVAWHRPWARYTELDGRFVLVLPVAAADGG